MFERSVSVVQSGWEAVFAHVNLCALLCVQDEGLSGAGGAGAGGYADEGYGRGGYGDARAQGGYGQEGYRSGGCSQSMGPVCRLLCPNLTPRRQPDGSLSSGWGNEPHEWITEFRVFVVSIVWCSTSAPTVCLVATGSGYDQGRSSYSEYGRTDSRTAGYGASG